MLSHRLRRGQRRRPDRGPADLHLDRAKALGKIVVGLLQQRVDREIEVDAAGIARHAGIEAAEQPEQRQVRAPRLQVPQRDVERRQRQHHRAAASAIMQAPPHPVPYRLGVVRLEARDKLGDLAPDDVGDCIAVAADRIGVADALRAIGIAHPAGDQLERRHLAMRAVGQGHTEWNAIQPGLDRCDQCHRRGSFPGFLPKVMLVVR